MDLKEKQKCFINVITKKCAKLKKKCRDPGSNRGPLDLQSNALPTELSRLMQILSYYFSPNTAFKSPCEVTKKTCLPKTDREIVEIFVILLWINIVSSI